MNAVTILKNKVETLNKEITVLLPNAHNGDQSAIRLCKAYQQRIDAMRMAIMEVQGLGETVMINALNKKS